MFFLIVLLCALSSSASTSLSGLHVSGNKILNSNNQAVQLRGVDHAGTEYACIQGWGIFDGPSNQTLVNGILSWNANIVRVPLNEDCWLGINGVPSQYGGSNYQSAIVSYVQLLNNNGLAVILDLHWTAPGTTPATGQLPMPDMDHSPAFWTGVGNTFGSNLMVIFDVFNEPYPDNAAWNSSAGWTCWKNGGTCNGINFQVAGMQTLVNTIRATGAKNILMLGGLAWSNSLAEWLHYAPTDSLNNLAASWHSYNFNQCNNQNCWEQTISPVAAKVPVIVGESGENDCATGYVDSLYGWLDSQSFTGHYLGWGWNIADCSSFPALITNYNGSPTPYGVGLQSHLKS